MATRGRPRKDAACRTCKIRRVKCDETKPECVRCTSTGRKCDGYVALDNGVMALKLFSNSQELRSFKYFCEKTSLEITSYYDETFWQSLVLQLSHANSGLGHLVVALGSLHESIKDPLSTFSNPHPSSSQLVFSLRQCNKAISNLTRPNIQPNIGIMLASCVLIMAFEMIQNRLDVALKQFRIGTRILQDWRQQPRQKIADSDRDLIDNTLSPILNRFGESLGFVSTNDIRAGLERTSLSERSTDRRPYTIPGFFVTLGAARSSLHNALDYIFEDLRLKIFGAEIERSDFYSRLRPVLDSWYESFKRFVDNLKTNVSDSNRRKICLLNIQYLIGGVTFAACVFKDEMIYDRYLSSFSKIMDLCTEVVEIETGKKFNGKVSSMAFSFDLGILMPLYFVTWRCRDPNIRRRALEMLQNCPRREGIFLSWITGMVSDQIINIEEDGRKIYCCDDVAIENRIQSMHMHYNPRPFSTRNGTTVYEPMLEFTWATWKSRSGEGAIIKKKEFDLPAGDITLGTQPYWVVMPSVTDISHWKLLLARKVFEEPDISGGYTEILKNLTPII